MPSTGFGSSHACHGRRNQINLLDQSKLFKRVFRLIILRLLLQSDCTFRAKDPIAAKASGAAQGGSFVDRMIHSKKTMAVFFGSQTGTAEDFAQRLAKQAKRYGISAAVCDPEECEMVCPRHWVANVLFLLFSL